MMSVLISVVSFLLLLSLRQSTPPPCDIVQYEHRKIEVVTSCMGNEHLNVL